MILVGNMIRNIQIKMEVSSHSDPKLKDYFSSFIQSLNQKFSWDDGYWHQRVLRNISNEGNTVTYPGFDKQHDWSKHCNSVFGTTKVDKCGWNEGTPFEVEDYAVDHFEEDE